MNCKAGDLAVIVRVTPKTTHALGALVSVIKRIEDRNYTTSFGVASAPCWQVQSVVGVIKNHKGDLHKLFACPDLALRPIRDNPCQDETLTWLDVPSTDRVSA